jgi:hypothetical protein
VRALKWECSYHVSAELDVRGFAFFQELIDVKGLDLQSVIVVERGDDQPDAITLLYRDD